MNLLPPMRCTFRKQKWETRIGFWLLPLKDCSFSAAISGIYSPAFWLSRHSGGSSPCLGLTAWHVAKFLGPLLVSRCPEAAVGGLQHWAPASVASQQPQSCIFLEVIPELSREPASPSNEQISIRLPEVNTVLLKVPGVVCWFLHKHWLT